MRDVPREAQRGAWRGAGRCKVCPTVPRPTDCWRIKEGASTKVLRSDFQQWQVLVLLPSNGRHEVPPRPDGSTEGSVVEAVRAAVRGAVQILHDQSLVHRDTRLPNVATVDVAGGG